MSARRWLQTLLRALCIASLALAQICTASETDSPPSTAANPATDLDRVREQLIEEITVVGKKSTSQLRNEIEAADQQVYSIFNELNTDDDYDIECRKEARVGRHLATEQCRARIFWEARSLLAEEDMEVATNQPLANQAAHQRILNEKLREIARTNPQLLEAMLRREILKRELEKRKK